MSWSNADLAKPEFRNPEFGFPAACLLGTNPVPINFWLLFWANLLFSCYSLGCYSLGLLFSWLCYSLLLACSSLGYSLGFAILLALNLCGKSAAQTLKARITIDPYHNPDVIHIYEFVANAEQNRKIRMLIAKNLDSFCKDVTVHELFVIFLQLLYFLEIVGSWFLYVFFYHFYSLRSHLRSIGTNNLKLEIILD